MHVYGQTIATSAPSVALNCYFYEFKVYVSTRIVLTVARSAARKSNRIDTIKAGRYVSAVWPQLFSPFCLHSRAIHSVAAAVIQPELFLSVTADRAAIIGS